MDHELDFLVTICLGYGDGGDVIVTTEVSEEEYELLKQCCLEDSEIEEFEGLEALYERVVEAAKDESECCEPDDEEDIEYDDAYYTVAIPDEIYDAVKVDAVVKEIAEAEEGLNRVFAVDGIFFVISEGKILTMSADAGNSPHGWFPTIEVDDFGELCYEWEGEWINLYENVCNCGEEPGSYDSLSADDWVRILGNLDDFVVEPDEECEKDEDDD